MSRPQARSQAGFTLLEVMVAFAILAVAVVSLIELASQGLRLLKLSGDHQQALDLADRIARDTQVHPDDAMTAAVDSGEEGNFTWERRIARLPLPEELEPRATTPGKELPGLYAVSVAVRWGRGHTVEVATLRAPSAAEPATPAAQTPAAGAQSPARGQGSQAAPGTGGLGPLGAGIRQQTR